MRASVLQIALLGGAGFLLPLSAQTMAEPFPARQPHPTITITHDGDLRTYQLATTAELRDHRPPEKQITFSEDADHATVRTGNPLFDGLYAMSVNEARLNSVSQISDDAYAHGEPIHIDVFQTGEFWKYVWTRDLSYSLDLGLAGFDPRRAVNSLLFKSSGVKSSVDDPIRQIVQDTGSGGSYPISTDRVVWALGAHAALKQLDDPDRTAILQQVCMTLAGTVEQDRHLVFDAADGLYRGEQSFLDWREQTYPGWTKDNVLPIGMSKALSTNVAHFVLLTHLAEYAGLLDDHTAQTRYSQWADELRKAINARFWDATSGLYSAYLLSDDGVSDSVRVARYDLLGESLAILSGVADEKRAASIIEHYPTGPWGPPVVWPQERTVPIYHNQAIWPFVTAYWTRAAQQVGNVPAVCAGVESLERLAALNLSNMENFDFVTGQAQVTTGPRQGPVISSRRQLWSVAAYLSMVQDVVFGLETSWDGVRFRPFITEFQRHGEFHDSEILEWRGFAFRGTHNRVRVHLPPLKERIAQGFCVLEKVELNGKPVGTNSFVPRVDLRAENEWEIFLGASGDTPSEITTLRHADVGNERAVCGPVQPTWTGEGQSGLTLDADRLTLHFAHPDDANVAFTVYRDGQPCAKDIHATSWTDPDSGNHHDAVHTYRVSATDSRTGLASHLTPARAYRTPDQSQVIPATSIHHRGGDLVGNHHFANWGRPGDELTADLPAVSRAGSYLVRAEFANGAGPVNTGITCAVKKLEVRNADSGATVAAGYFVMPQSGDWKRFDLSSAVKVDLSPGIKYVVRISEDEWCRNMSFLQSNARYTSASGGGDTSYNFVDIAALHLLLLHSTR